MSALPSPTRRLTIPDLVRFKGTRPIVSLTAYTAPMAALLDDMVDMLLVGDSLGMVLYGMESTLPVTLEDMIRHAEVVVRATRHACVIVDMPFGSYQASPRDAFLAAAQVLKETGAQGVKLEGGLEMAETVAFLTTRAIPVMAHIGLKPQHVNVMGGYKSQGKTEAGRAEILADAKAMVAAGAFSLLLEGVESATARAVTESVTIPTIGIGAGAGCDGQIVVTEDMLGLFERTPKFVRRFGAMREMMKEAVAHYRDAVKDGSFPNASESYTARDAMID
jgi:3-methyl-2-oxobutanoate hydroxymethyltransferase